MLLMLLEQQFHRRLGDGHQPHRVFRLGPGQLKGAIRVADVLPAHRDGSALGVYIHPPQGYQFPLPQAAGQFQIEHGHEPSRLGGLQVGVDVLRRQDLHVQFSGLGHNTVLAGVSLDQPLLHSPVQGTVEHQVDTADGGGAQPLVLVLSDVYSAALQ